MQSPWPEILTAASGLFGVAIGVIGTWQFQKHEQRLAEKKQRAHSVKLAQVVLATHQNALLGLWNQYLKKSEFLANRHREIKSIGDYLDHLQIDVQSLSFLVDVGDPQLLVDVNLHMGNYNTVRGILRHRNQLMVTLEQNAKVLSVDPETGFSQQEISVIDDFKVKEITDHLYQSVEDAIDSARELNGSLSTALNKIDSKAKALKCDYPPLEHLSLQN